MTALAITIGRSRRNPRGRSVPLVDGVPAARALATALEAQPKALEAWWSVHTWKDGHRTADRWSSAMGVGVDIDYHDEQGEHVAAPAAQAAQLEQLAREGKLPGSVFHATPRGARLVFVFREPTSDRDVFARAARGAATLVQAALRLHKVSGYVVDEKALLDLARLLYTPQAQVDGVQRQAEVLVLREEPYDPLTLAPPPSRPRLAPAASVGDASKRYRLDRHRDWPRHSERCPACGHDGCFGRFPDDPSRWACFSASHSGVGIQGPGCWHGDVLDLDAHAAGCTPAELLKREGYLAPAAPSAPAQSTLPAVEEAPAEIAALKGIGKTYASLCAILRNDRRIIAEPLEWNEMLCGPVVGDRELEDHDTGAIRERIELTITNSKGKPLQFAAGDIEKAVYQVAHERPFHPVREYLEQLVWDGTPRVEAVAEELLGLERTRLHQVLLRRWFIGSVARIFRPGCELQMVLVFAGPEGKGKSRFFKTLVGQDWFSDARVDIRDKDALQLLQRIWMLEWGELAAIRGAQWEDIKAFITSTTNDFRPPYGRRVIRAPRHCVIVGTVNEDEFLHGREGERRFWPLRIPAAWSIPLDQVAAWRDQLWAEAVRLFRSGEQWWLTDEETALLREAAAGHVERHPWEDLISEWLASWTAEVTTSAVLEKAIRKPAGNWTRGDTMAVASVMKRLGYVRPGDQGRGRVGSRERVWTKAEEGLPNLPNLENKVGEQVGEVIPS